MKKLCWIVAVFAPLTLRAPESEDTLAETAIVITASMLDSTVEARLESKRDICFFRCNKQEETPMQFYHGIRENYEDPIQTHPGSAEKIELWFAPLLQSDKTMQGAWLQAWCAIDGNLGNPITFDSKKMDGWIVLFPGEPSTRVTISCRREYSRSTDEETVVESEST